MAKKKGFGISPITNTIYYGTQDTEKHMWIGQKIDVTDDVIAAVYEWFMGNMEDSEGKKEEYQIIYPSTEFELVMRRKKTENIQLEVRNNLMWINRTKYEVEKLKYRQRISYLENLICPCESHDYVEIAHEIIDEHSTAKHIFRCKKCGKLHDELS